MINKVSLLSAFVIKIDIQKKHLKKIKSKMLAGTFVPTPLIKILNLLVFKE